MARLRYNNQGGKLATVGTDVTNSTSATVINFQVAPNFATITGSDYIPIALDAGGGTFEVVYLTAYTAAATTGTVTRQAEDATLWPAVAHAGGTWSHDPTAADFTATATLVGTETLTNKRITKRILSLSAPSATPAINTDSYDVVAITALANAITSFTTNLTGTPVQGDQITFEITDNGTGRALTWGAKFEASGNVPLPTTTYAGVLLTVAFRWNVTTSKFTCVGWV
jgi:hypothetical protein